MRQPDGGRLKAARFPTYKTLDNFDFTAQPSVNKTLVGELMRCVWIEQRENVLLVGNSGAAEANRLVTNVAVKITRIGNS